MSSAMIMISIVHSSNLVYGVRAVYTGTFALTNEMDANKSSEGINYTILMRWIIYLMLHCNANARRNHKYCIRNQNKLNSIEISVTLFYPTLIWLILDSPCIFSRLQEVKLALALTSKQTPATTYTQDGGERMQRIYALVLNKTFTIETDK